MTEPLTRAQVAAQLHLLYLAKAHDLGWPVRHECDVPYDRLTPDGQALDLMFADWHLAQMDAALREQLAEANKTMADAWVSMGEKVKRIETVKAERDLLCQQLVEVRTELASYAWTVTPAMVQAQIDQLNQQLATTHEHLESQRRVTYEAIEREHALKRQLVEMTQEWITMLTQTSLDLRTVPLPDGVEQAKVRINLWIKKLKETL